MSKFTQFQLDASRSRPWPAEPWTALGSPAHIMPESVAWAVGKSPTPPPSGLHTALQQFAPVDLSDMKRAALLDRCEVKYVMHIQTLLQVLPALPDAYAVLEIDGQRLNRYRTLYFDTDDFALYRRHHMGARSRYKVRTREYVETHATFLEVKHKINKRRTIKHRVPTPTLATQLEADSASFLDQVCPYRAEELVPRLWNHYRRITLLSHTTQERVTIDIDLNFQHQSQQQGLPGIVIAEVKRPSVRTPSPFVDVMRARHIRRTGFSKYCMGVSLLYPEIKHNRFKPTHRLLARLVQEANHVNH